MSERELTAIEAKFEAQKIAFGPFYFQAAVAIKELGLLDALVRKRGPMTPAALAEACSVSLYAAKTLCEAGFCAGLLTRDAESNAYEITKVGRYIRADRMTEVNFNFTQEVCYAGLARLTESFRTGRPEGLKVFGDWPTVYEGLSELPDGVKKAWFEFDQFYSDDAFICALDLVFAGSPRHVLDIGGNTGKWAEACCKRDPDVEVTLVDLPGQLQVAEARLGAQPFAERVRYAEVDLLDDAQSLPTGADVVWMSQFLDCFGDDEIRSILTRVHQAIDDDATVYILEPFWDNQEFEAGRFCLVGTSLYFSCIANGNSKMLGIDEMTEHGRATGFELVSAHPLLGDSYHTLLKLKKRAAA